MQVFERFIASGCPPENGSVLWINTSKTPITLNMQLGGQWQVLGAIYDAEMLQKILDAIGEINLPEYPDVDSLADAIKIIIDTLQLPTEAEIRAMFRVLQN